MLIESAEKMGGGTHMNAEQHVRPDRLGTVWFKLVTGLTSLRFSLSAGPLPVVTENAKRNG